MREERIAAIEEELSDIARMMQLKKKFRAQAEAGKNYRVCEHVTEEIMALKSRKRELDAERSLFVIKARRAKRRERKVQQTHESESSEVDAGGPSSSCSTSRSVTPAPSQTLLPFAKRGSLSSSLSPPHSQELDQDPSVEGGPFGHGTRINPIDCESDSALSDDSPCVSDRDSHF